MRLFSCNYLFENLKLYNGFHFSTTWRIFVTSIGMVMQTIKLHQQGRRYLEGQRGHCSPSTSPPRDFGRNRSKNFTFKRPWIANPPQPTDFDIFLRPCNQRGLKGPSLDSHILHWMLDSASVKYAAKFLILFSEKFHRSTNNNIAQRSGKTKTQT